MKKFYVLFLMLLACAGVSAQNDNHKISYQAVVRNAANQLMYDTDLTVAVELANSENGPVVYAETHAVHSNANGLISLLIGDGTYVSGSWDAIHWNAAWVKATISKSGTTLAVHHLPLTAVPFALYADQVNPAALADYLTENHYLTEEVQVLSISHDTVFLTGGSFVKLPAGFSGNYNDLTNKPDLDQYATNAHLNDTLGHYPTTQTLKDTAAAIRNDFPVVPENVSAFNNDAGYLTKDSAVITNLQGDVTNLQGDVTNLQGDVTHLQEATRKDALCDSVEACVKGWISDSTRMVYDSLHTYYVNTNTLRDTAAAIRGDIPDVSGFATKDELRADSTVLANRIVTDSTALHNAIKDTATAIRADICDSATVCITKALADPASEINHALDTIARNNIHDTAEVLRSQMPVVNNGQITIKVNNQGTEEVSTFGVNQPDDQLITITIPEEVAVNNGQLTVITQGDTTRFTANQADNDTVNLEGFVTTEKLNDTLNAYYTKNQVNDTLGHYTTTDKVDTLLGDYVTTTKLNDTLTRYTTTDKVDTLLGDYAKTAETCVKGWIGDTLNAYTTTDKIDTLLGDYVTIEKLNDTLSYYTTTDKVDTLLGDYVTTTKLNDTLNAYYTKEQVNDTLSYYTTTNKIDTLLGDYVTTTKLNDTLNAYYDTTNVQQILHDTANVLRNEMPVVNNGQITISVNRGTVENSTFNVNQDGTQTVTINIPDEVTVNNGQLTVITQDDTTRFTANQSVNDTVNLEGFVTTAHLNDTLNAYYTKEQVNDTLSYYTTTDKIDTLLGDYVTTTKLNDTLSHYTTTDKIDTLLGDYVTTEKLNDTLNAYYTKEQVNDTLNDYYTKEQVNDTLSYYTTTDKIDTLLGEYVTTTHLNDTLSTVYTKIQSDSTTLVDRIVTEETCVKGWIGDTLNAYTTTDKIDTLLGDYVTIEKLNDTLSYYTTTDKIDTLLGDYVTTTHLNDTLSTVYSKIQSDSTTLVDRIVTDSTALVNRIVADSNALAHRMDTLLTHVCDSVEECVSQLVHDSIGNGTLTIQKNGTDLDSFTANQKSDKTINITVPTTVAEFPDEANYAKVAANNQFTGTNTVPRGFDMDTTNGTNCNNVVVNACDLWAVFDSLSRRIDALQEELDALKNATPPTVSLSLSEVQYTSMKATATALGNGADITSYKFCISTNSNMSGATCFTSTSNEYTFTGLNPYTLYYVTADATSLAGTSTSNVVSQRTPMHAPTGSFSLESIAPKGFKVAVNSLDFKEPGEGTVQICYKKNESGCPTDFTSYTTCDGTLNIANGITDTLREFTYVDDADVEYCVIVKLTNGDSTTILEPLTINTGAAVALNITYSPETLNLCGGSLDVTFTATINPSSEDLNDYENFTWSDGTSNGTTTTVTYSTSGKKIITCTATHKTEGFTITGTDSIDVVNIGSNPTFAFCIDSLSVNIKSIASDATTLNWGDGSAEESNPSTSSSHNYASDGIYSIMVTNADGCSTSKQAAVGVATLHPCTVATINTNEQGSDGTIETLQDVDGNLYGVVQIGKQCWMKSNLRTTHFSDGTAIANGTGNNANNTRSYTTAYYYQPTSSSHFDNDYDFSHYNLNTYGLYYNWKATMHGAAGSTTVPSGVQGVCPTGWHVPSFREWDTLIAFVQTLPNATNYDHHSIGYIHALSGGCDWNVGGDGHPGYYQGPAWNSSEFSALPAGEAGSTFRENITSSQTAYFWTASEAAPFAGSPQSYNFEFHEGSSAVLKRSSYANFGYSVRCVRDYGEGSPVSDPTVTTDSATAVDRTTATLNGTILNPDNVNLTAKGFEWKPSSATEYTPVTVTGDGLTYDLTGLTAGTSYTYRAFISSSIGTVYGEIISFTTLTQDPTVATNDASEVEDRVATLNGTITNPDSLTITSKGFEWKISSATEYTPVDVTGNELTYNLTGLTGGTEYSFKAFMVFEGDTLYGEVKTFTTKTSPTVATNAATSVGENTATLNATITNPDSVEITSKGFEWKVSTATDFNDTVTVTGDEFTYNLTGLTAATNYTYRAFIVTAGGTIYGDNVDFETPVPTPQLTITSDATSGATTICSGGSTVVTYTASLTLGGTPMAVSSYSWSVPSSMQYLTNGNTCTVIYTSTGTYTVTCTATPANGDPAVTGSEAVAVSTASGTAPTFVTCENDATLSVEVKSSNNVNSFDWGGTTSSSSNSGCTYSNDGAYIITAVNDNCMATRLIAVGLATTRPCSVATPHTDNTKYTSTTGGLETVNDEGKVVTMQDQDGHTYAVVQVGDQCWMRFNLRTTKFSDGTTISNGTKTGGTTHTLNNTSPYYYKPVSNATAYLSTDAEYYDVTLYNELTYGLYYNWAAAMHGASSSTSNPSGVQGICPKGWHLPSSAEWSQMYSTAATEARNKFGNAQVPSGQDAFTLSGGCEWIQNGTAPSTYYYKPGDYYHIARNYSGFTAIPTGYARQRFSSNVEIQQTDFWTSQETNATYATYWQIYYGVGDFKTNKQEKRYGFSVRCVRD